MSLGGSGQNLSYVTAIDDAVAAGVVVVAASNKDVDAIDYSPAFVPSAITAIVDAVNCIGEDVGSFDWVSLSWSPEVGTVTDYCSTSTGVCQATQSGIRKKTGSVQFTLNGSMTMISKP